MAGQPGRSGGQNRKPTEVKRRLGNPGRRPLPATIVALQSVEHTEQVPVFGSGNEMVQYALDHGANVWIGASDAPTVDVARRLFDALLVATDPRDIVRLADALNRCLSRLGLDPTARAALGIAEVKARTKLEELRDRRESRAGRQGS